MQGEDKDIRVIRENLIGNPNAYNSYLLKSGLVCKKYTIFRPAVTYLGIYVPTSILNSVILYVHRKNLHTSLSQTTRDFLANYYHPRARRAVKEVCDKCIKCSQSRNKDKTDTNIGRERTLHPIAPRESVSADILYFPKSAAGYTHGLLIADLFSLYISFYPMRSKSSAEVSKNFSSYFAAHGVPRNIYTDSDQSFRGDTESLFRVYGVRHLTSYPYTQKENAVEAQVRIFKNAYRGAIQESEIFKSNKWESLYPIVICRINSMISKYGMSREAVHYGTIVESSLPLITDCELFSPLEDDLVTLTNRFRDKIGRFLMKKKRNKTLYKIGKAKKFFIHELVMKENYAPDSLLAPVFSGPFRITDLAEQGATLRDIKTGDMHRVAFEHLRKITLDEFLSLLPQNFDAEILDT